MRLTIDKRIPVAAGMAGGSADAAAALRLLARAAGIGDDALLHELAAGLGADVPAQVRPGRVLATGAGETLEPLRRRAATACSSLPSHARAVDRRRLPRGRPPRACRATPASWPTRCGGPGRGWPTCPTSSCVNDLEPAALSLCPAIEDALEAVRAAGADVAMVSGSRAHRPRACSATPGRAARAAAALARRPRSPPVGAARRGGAGRREDRPALVVAAALVAAFLVLRRRKLEPTLLARRRRRRARPAGLRDRRHPPAQPQERRRGRRRRARRVDLPARRRAWPSSRPARSSA